MKNKILLLTLVALPLGSCKNTQEKKESEKMDIYLLLGQSNMAGRGILDSTELCLDKIYVFNKNDKWEEAKEPIHFDKPMAGTCLATSFAIEVQRVSNNKVGLIPCAVGGTSINHWHPNILDSITNVRPYNQAVSRTQKALKKGRLKGILWHQGEGDSANEGYITYESKFNQLLMNLSNDLHIDIDTIPVIVGELGTFFTAQANRKNAYRIDSVLRKIAEKKINLYCVSSSGLTHKGDSTHFDTESLRELGKRYAEGYNIVLKREKKHY